MVLQPQLIVIEVGVGLCALAGHALLTDIPSGLGPSPKVPNVRRPRHAREKHKDSRPEAEARRRRAADRRAEEGSKAQPER